MDTIWNAAFGIDINLQLDHKGDDYYNKCEAVFRGLENKNAYIYISSKYFPRQLTSK